MKNLTFSIAVGTAALTLLSACGGASTSQNATYASLVNDLSSGTNGGDYLLEGGGLSPVTPDAYFNAGTVNYTGEIAILNDPSTLATLDAIDDENTTFRLVKNELRAPDLIGQMALTANITDTSGTYTATASNFLNIRNEAQAGSLSIASGTLTTDPNYFDLGSAVAMGGTLRGTLTDSDGTASNYNASVGGIVLDDNGPLIAGFAGNEGVAAGTTPFVALFAVR